MPTREGYDFAGWFTSKTGGKKITENSRAEDNLIAYAQWKQKAIINPINRNSNSCNRINVNHYSKLCSIYVH